MQRSLRFTAELSGRYRDFSVYPLLSPHMQNLPINSPTSMVHLLQPMNLHWLIFSPRVQNLRRVSLLLYGLWVWWNVEWHVPILIVSYRIYTLPYTSILHLFTLPPPPPPISGNRWSSYCLHGFVFSPAGITQYVAFSDWLLSLKYAFKVLTWFSFGLKPHFFWVSNSNPWSGWTCLFLSFGNYE